MSWISCVSEETNNKGLSFIVSFSGLVLPSFNSTPTADFVLSICIDNYVRCFKFNSCMIFCFCTWWLLNLFMFYTQTLSSLFLPIWSTVISTSLSNRFVLTYINLLYKSLMVFLYCVPSSNSTLLFRYLFAYSLSISYFVSKSLLNLSLLSVNYFIFFID